MNKSFRPDVNFLQFYFVFSIDVFTCIQGNRNPVDVCAKLDSPLTEVLILTLATG